MKRRHVLAFGAVFFFGAGACNLVLGIEEGSARPPPEIDAELPDAPGLDTAPPIAPPSCTLDSDCVAPNGCYTGHCDTVVGACAYHFCDAPKACAQGTCNPASVSCDAPVDYNFRATRYPVPNATLGCQNASQCVAALFPFLFIGTKDNTIALLVDDRLAKAAHPIKIKDLAMKPAQIVASGRRLWVVGDVQGGAPPYHLALAYIDVPSDPTAALVAISVTIEYPFPTVTGLSAPGSALYLVFNDPGHGFPTALLAPPFAAAPKAALADSGTSDLPMHAVAAQPAGASITATSGPRLVMYRSSVANLITGPATAAVAVGADMNLNPGLPAFQVPRFAQGPDGTVMLSAPIQADTDCDCTTHARLQWLLPNAFATALDANQYIDPAGWSNPNAGLPNVTCHACPASYFITPALSTWVDAHTALTVTASQDPDRTLAFVRTLGRDPLAGDPKRLANTLAAEVPKGNFGSDRIALTSASGFGYLVLSNNEGNTVTVSIYDPDCDAK